MDIKKYANEVKDIIGGEVITVVKNGIPFVGIRKDVEDLGDKKLAANIYVNEYAEAGKSVEEAAEIINETFNNLKAPKFDFAGTENYEVAKKKLSLRLYKSGNQAPDTVTVNAEKFGFEDLVIIPEIIWDIDGETTGSSCVNSDLLKTWGVTVEEVVADAISNSKENVVFKTLNGVMEDLGRDDLPAIPNVYVLTNKSAKNGASEVIVYADELAKKFPDGYYVLPSSVHEVIIADARCGVTKETLDGMVREVNANCVEPEDLLSDHAYFIKRASC
jgi:hypothetical protein